MGAKISQQEWNELRSQGYGDAEIQQALKEIEREELQGSYSNVQQQRGADPRQNSRMSSFATKQDDNIIRWQLELNDILERAEHILRGDIPTFTNGEVIWELSLIHI